MAFRNRYGRMRYYGSKPSVNNCIPVINDLNSYVSKPRDIRNSFPYARPQHNLATSTSVDKVEVIDLTGNSVPDKPVATTSAKPMRLDMSKTVDFREQRTLSSSTVEVLYNAGEQKRPAKRRHHSSVTPGYQDDVPVEHKRARPSFSNPATVIPRHFRFNSYDAPPPVFTLDTLSVEIQEECQKIVQTKETLEKKLKLKDCLENLFSKSFPGGSLHLTGSSRNGFGSEGSDADFCFVLSSSSQSHNRIESLTVLRRMQRVISKDHYFQFLNKCTVVPASVPIIKFVDTISGCECDINVNNTVGVRNTHLLRAYCGVDSRVRPLVVVVKKWAKTQGINDASQGTLSSYALTLMVIHYLQAVCMPAVVPVLQRTNPKLFNFGGSMSELSQQDPCKDIACNQSENKQSLGELFVGFFKYYAEGYRWSDYYISVAMGFALPKTGGHWQRKHITIEEPFDGNNVAKAVCSLDAFNTIQRKFRLAWHTLKISPSLESIKVR